MRFIWHPVRSPVIAAVGYDAIDRVLMVRFTKGTVYRYPGVPRYMFDSLRHAWSPGQYFNRVIRDNYSAERVDEPGAERIRA